MHWAQGQQWHRTGKHHRTIAGPSIMGLAWHLSLGKMPLSAIQYNTHSKCDTDVIAIVEVLLDSPTI